MPQDQQFQQSNLAQYVIATKSLKERDALRLRTLQLFRDDFPNVRGRVKLLPNATVPGALITAVGADWSAMMITTSSGRETLSESSTTTSWKRWRPTGKDWLVPIVTSIVGSLVWIVLPGVNSAMDVLLVAG